MMGGDVTVRSATGQGSVFTIKLPAIVTEAKPEEPIETIDGEDLGGLLNKKGEDAEPMTVPTGGRVLVIDDDPTQRDLIKRFLSKEGFSVCIASRGEEGLRLARELRPDAITLDVMMPGMDGWSVLSALKADRTLRDIPVIMLTMVDDPARGFALGAADVATKPVDRSRLSKILRKYTCPHPPCPVLLVEDDPATREVTRTILQKEGWKVTEAENGRVALECMERSRPPVILLDLMMHSDTTIPGDYVMLAVSDTEIGMTEENKAHLFEAFFTTKQYGTGLGLATCRTIVQQSGGHIVVCSDIGKGTTFKVYLPRVELPIDVTEPMRPAAARMETLRAVESAFHILVVDNEVSVRQLTTEMLTRAGFEADGAADGAAGWEALQAQHYDLVITDNFMPKVTGIEMVKKIHAAHIQLPVIMATAIFPQDEFILHPWLQAIPTLLKPFGADKLLSTVRNALGASMGGCEEITSPD